MGALTKHREETLASTDMISGGSKQAAEVGDGVRFGIAIPSDQAGLHDAPFELISGGGTAENGETARVPA